MTTGFLGIRGFVLKTATNLAWIPQSAARLCLGVIFVQSGWGKLHNLARVVDYFASLGVPAPQLQAPFVASVELVGGLLLLGGLLTRVASVPLAVTMVVALLTAKRGDIHGLADLFGTTEFLYLLTLGYLAGFGAGPLSLDALLVRAFGKDTLAEEGVVKLPSPAGI